MTKKPKLKPHPRITQRDFLKLAAIQRELEQIGVENDARVKRLRLTSRVRSNS